MTDRLFAPRVRWVCRRGMKEVEEVLLPFFEAEYAQMTVDEQTQFADLLECSDPDLFTWLIQHATPEANTHRAMVARILAFTHA